MSPSSVSNLQVTVPVIPAMPDPDLREHLAAERTFLAWIRTALAIIAFGFVLGRVGHMYAPPGVRDPSLWFGALVALFGVALNILSIFEYRALIARMNQAHGTAWPPARLPIATAVFVAVCGALLGVYVIAFP